ncbi:hypothetical protein CPR19088_GLDEOEPO_01377 [Companilactobacillus paralimentarius]
MTTNLAKVPVKELVRADSIKNKFNEVLGKRGPQFVSSIVNIVNSNQDLKNVDQTTVISSALVAASLDLPINQNFGYMYIVPYAGKAQPQMGYKGYIQLAQRSGQYKRLNAISVYKDEFHGWNPLTEELNYQPQFKDRDKDEEPIGYVGTFKLLNGFEKTVFWTHAMIDDHRQKFSKMSGKQKPTGVWATDFDAMALKTVLRNLIGKWGPMSVDMQTAFLTDEDTMDDTNDIKDVDVTEHNDAPAKTVDQLIPDEVNDPSANEEKKPATKKRNSAKSKATDTKGIIDDFEKEVNKDADTNN